MKRPSLDRLDAFLAVADAGGFTAATRRTGVSKNALSQQIAKLEQELGVALFNRTTRQVVPTPAGERLRHASKPLLKELRSTLDAVSDVARRPSGTLRLSAPLDFSASVLGPAIAEFAELYPELRIDLITGDEILDLIGERIDLSVRLGWLRDSSLKAVKIGAFRQFVVAAPVYLDRAGVPTHPSHLSKHHWIELNLLRTPLLWRFRSENGQRCQVRVRSAIRTNSPDGVLGLLRGGAGISVATDFAAATDIESGALVRLLPRWSLPRGGIYLTWPGSGPPPAKVRVFIDYCRERLRT